ncbi:MAG TPA: efflux RND transporter permease subunit, partial [Elusimicrobiota bacterium]|nr:efflux RND transporter permease subunit [Elusimicrobiota bacterium]
TRELKSIPGVADVTTFGGPRRTIEVRLQPDRLAALGLSAAGVAQALGLNHANAGGSILTHGEEAYVVRSLGLYQKPEDLEWAVVGTRAGNVPVRVRDLGGVRLSHAMRLGQVGHDGSDDAVEGIVLLRKGADTLKTCAAVRAKVAALNAGRLPRGVRIRPLYDRTTLIERSSHTVFHNIAFGIALVCGMLAAGFGTAYWPLVAAVVLIIPFALLTAFVGMAAFGYAPNLISLGAVDFGIIVETAIFAAESVLHFVRSHRRKDSVLLREALSDVLGPALLCAVLLAAAFVPILSLQRVEGRIFRPLGITLVSALVGGQLGALIFVPFCSLWLPTGEHPAGALEPLFEKAARKARAVGTRVAAWPRAELRVAGGFAAALLLLNWGLGREFMPQLNEGALYIRATAPSTISLESSVELARSLRSRIRELPEVVGVVSQIGRPDDGTDVNGFNNIEMPVLLKAPDTWRTARTVRGLIQALQEKLDTLEGVELNYSQPIKDNVDEAISGVKGELVVKVFGPGIQELQGFAEAITKAVRGVRGAEDVAPEQLLGQPELRWEINREILARYGVSVTEAEEVLETALLGKLATRLMDPQGRFVDVLARPDLPDPPSQRDLALLPLTTPEGARIHLDDVSTARLQEGTARIYREGGERRIAVKMSVRGRAVVDFVNEAHARIDAAVHLPPGYHMEWSGSFENAQRAGRQLMTVVPVCLAVMIVFLYSWFGSWTPVGLLLWEVPFSAVGGLLALRLAGLNLSISAAAGAIVLIGVSFLTGMILIESWRHSRDAWKALELEARGILLSSGVAIVGLVPAALSHGMGAETARPFAVTILGGLVTSLVFTLTLLPGLLARARLPEA